MTKIAGDGGSDGALLPLQPIEKRIYLIRGRKVMLDADLAELYQVETKRLNEAVRRNFHRFPDDFMSQLTAEEASALRSQIATLEVGRGRYSKYAPLAFTEHGVAMLSAVLKSERAVQMSILIIRAFVKLRELLASNRDLAQRMEKVETRLDRHGSAIGVLVDEIKKIKQQPERPKRRIGFVTERQR
jgi:hypothetical protein